MTHTPELWVERLYARIPAFYRQQDLEAARALSPGLDDDQALARAPLRGLLRTVAEQVAAVRQDIDDLWDDFFLETASDWVVPYLGDLVGTRLLPNPVGQSNRQDVRNTLAWRRSKGTPAMLADLASGTTGRPAEVVEGFRTLAWTQHADHVRLDRSLTPDLRAPAPLAALGTAADPFAHLPELRPPGRPGVAGRGLPAGPHELRTAVFHLRPLQVFPLRGVTPAAAAPGEAAAAGARSYTFDPLRQEGPLFAAGGVPVDPVAFRADPGASFGSDRDLVVRRAGVPLAIAERAGAADPAAGEASDGEPVAEFTFGNPPPGTRLHGTEGLRLLDPAAVIRLPAGVRITALWFPDAAAVPVRLGALDTALLPDQAAAFAPDAAIGAAGRLVLRVESDGAHPVRLPACELTVRDDRPPRAARHAGVPSAASRWEGAVLAYLPELFLAPGGPVDLSVGTDGSCAQAVPDPAGPPVRGRLLRGSGGQAWPPGPPAGPASTPYLPGGGVHRVRGLALADPSRFAGGPPLVAELHVVAGVPQLAGAVVTSDVPVTERLRQRFAVPAGAATWATGTFLPSRDAVADRLPAERTTGVLLRLTTATPAAAGDPPGLWPQCEVVLTDRAGAAVLAYLPEADLLAGPEETAGAWFAASADGSTWSVPAGVAAGPPGTLPPGAVLARTACGQVLPLEGAVPLRRRRVVTRRPSTGELLVEPGRGRFCLPADDPLLALAPADRDLTVDYAEACTGPVGARGAVPDPRNAAALALPATRVVAASGDAAARLPLARVHRSVAEAVAAAEAVWAATGVAADEVIEIADSASYAGPVRVNLGVDTGAGPAPRRQVVIRAARGAVSARPCLLPGTGGAPADAGAAVVVTGPPLVSRVDSLSLERSLLLSGLLVGGEVRVAGGLVTELRLGGCTVLPLAAAAADPAGPAVHWEDDEEHRSRLVISASIVAGVRTGGGVAEVSASDSVLLRAAGGRTGLALGGTGPTRTWDDEAGAAFADRPANAVDLRRVTVIGRLRAAELTAGDSLLAGLAVVDLRQNGCLRFCRVEPGSVLPRRYRCVPTDAEVAAGDEARPAFGSLRPRLPLFAAPGDASSQLLLTGSEAGDQVGAFAAAFPGLRRSNLAAKLAEFLPAGLRPVVVVHDGSSGGLGDPLPARRGPSRGGASG